MNTSQLTKEEYQLIGEKLFGHNYSKKTEESSKSTSKSQYNHWLNESKKDKGSEIIEPSVALKIKESIKLGIWLINNDKGKQGLQYLRMCISWLEKDYEESHSRLLSEYNLYEKMKERVYVKNNIDN